MDPDFDVRIADWLEDDPDHAPGPVLPTVVAAFPLITQRRPSRLPWRNLNMIRFALVGAAAAAIGVLLVGGAMFMFGRPNDSVGVPPPTPSAEPRATPSQTPSSTATAVPVKRLPSDGPLGAGRYAMRMTDAPVDVEFTVGNGWTSGGWYINTDTSSIGFWTVPNVYTDACDIATLPDAAIGPTVDDLVSALDGQRNTDMSSPVDVVVDGHTGVRVDLSPTKRTPDPCEFLTLWTDPNGEPGRAIDLSESGSQVQPVWILDVDGERVVIVAWSFTVDGAAADFSRRGHGQHDPDETLMLIG